MGNLTLNGATSGSITLAPTAVAGTNTLTLPATTGTVLTNASPAITTPTITGAVLAAGTASVAPLDFTAGTNLTTALAGAIEYDGKVFYGTPQSTQRGVIPGAQFFRLNSDLAGSNVSTAQNVFGVGVTLSSSTVYAFEAFYVGQKTTGSTSHSIGFGFGGTATLNNILYTGVGNNAGGTLPQYGSGGIYQAAVNTAANTLFVTATTTANVNYFAKLAGTVSINTGGTFIPQYTLSAAPGGAYSTVAGSYFMIYPIGASGANTSVGTWA